MLYYFLPASVGGPVGCCSRPAASLVIAAAGEVIHESGYVV